MPPLKPGDNSVTVSFELPESMLKWLRGEAAKQDRSMSWIIRHALTRLKGGLK